MSKKLRGLLTLFMALMVQISFAQQKTVAGTVTDGSGMPLPGVNVIVQDTDRGTQTDFDGAYSISVAQGEVLVLSYLGFETALVTVGASNTIDVSLAEDAAELQEVVILGYSTRGVEEVTGASVMVSSEDIAESPSVSVEQALQGKVSGLQISQTSGTPGAMQDIRIRGMSSINAGNQPLYVIDGVPVSSTNTGASDSYSSLNPLSSLNSQDIESITVLKDASATAAYGARGSNGVIVVTTKSGSSGETQFTFSSQIGVQNDAYNKRTPLSSSQRYELLSEALVASYGPNGTITQNPNMNLSNAVGIHIPSIDANYDGTSNYDWPGMITNNDALMQDYSFSATGGDEISSFYASLGYNKTEATVIGTDFERINGMFSYDRQLRDNVDFSTSMNVSSVKQDPVLENGSFFSNPFLTRILMNPFNNPQNSDGSWNIDLPFGSLPNIFYIQEENVTRNALNRALINANVDWELVDNLTFSNRVAIDYQMGEYFSYRNRYEGDADDFSGDSEKQDSKNFNLVFQSRLNYDFDLGDDHHFDVTALFEYQKNEYNYLYGYGQNFPADGLIQIGSASAAFDASSWYEDWYNVSYLGLLNYNYAGKYVVDGTIRREGSSRFAPGNRFGTFGSVGVAWNIHRENFMLDTPFNTLRLRGSYGITGNNDIDINSYQALLGFSGIYNASGAPAPTQFGNSDLTWEKGETFDVGLSFGLFDSRLTGSFAYFNRRTYDLLMFVPLSLTTGFEEQAQNVGEMTNKGIEADLAYEIFRTKDFNWSVSANIGTVENEVTELALGSDGNPLNPDAASSYKTTEVGLPAGAWYMRTWAGVDPETGAPTWYVNGVDGEVTSNYNQAERAYQDASALPTYSGGFGTRVSYKGFFAEADVYFAGGHKIYEQYAQFYMSTNSLTLGTYNGATELMDRWQQPGDITDVPALNYGGSNNFQATNSRHLYDGDFMRLKNVAIGYSLPTNFVGSIGIDGLTLTLRGTNVATWVKEDGLLLDPEVRANGYTTLTTPPVETYTLGVNIKF